MFDAVVVGSGATGGWAAKELTERGMKVALLEAGPAEPPPVEVDDAMRAAKYPIQSRSFAFHATPQYFVRDDELPYLTERSPFLWIRGRQLGGRLRTWSAHCPRMSDFDFTAASRDGHGRDWPIRYADVAPFYDRVERTLQITGTAEGLDSVPDGNFLPAPPLTAEEHFFKASVERRYPSRRVTAQRLVTAPWHTTLDAARATGCLTVQPDSIVSRLLLAPGGARVRGVRVVDRIGRRSHDVEAARVVLCASALETTRVLLNSTSSDHPHGVGNSSGLVGRNLMDHVMPGVRAIVRLPSKEIGVCRSDRGTLYVPNFRNVTTKVPGFRRGYGTIVGIFRTAALGPHERAALLRPPNTPPADETDTYLVLLVGFAETLASPDNRVTLAPGLHDAWGVPAAHIDFAYGANERALVADFRTTAAEALDALGVDPALPDFAERPPGLSIHEVGTVPMGDDRRTSVLDPHNRCWDVPNLYVTDASCFVSSGSQNPTLTMMALTARACAHMTGAL